MKAFSIRWRLSKYDENLAQEKWMDDGILMVYEDSKTDKTAIVLDTAGKQISYSTKPFNLQNRYVGIAEIIVLEEIDAEAVLRGDFFNGQIWTIASTSNSELLNNSTTVPVTNKQNKRKTEALVFPFVSPQKLFGEHTAEKRKRLAGSVKESDLIMPRPTLEQQNNQDKVVQDVKIKNCLAKVLKPQQKETVKFLYKCVMGLNNEKYCGAILADDTNSGKIHCAVALISTLLTSGPFGGEPICDKVLIITSSLHVKTWEKEFRKYFGSEELKVFAIGLENSVDDFLTYRNHQVLIISYEMFGGENQEKLTNYEFDIAVCDEVHWLKNAKIQIHNALETLPTKKRIILTGSCIQYDLEELYASVNFVNPGIMGQYSGFHRNFIEPIRKSKEQNAACSEVDIGLLTEEELNQAICHFVLLGREIHREAL